VQHRQSRNGTEAKFSLRFVAALALHGRDTADPASFADAVVDDPALAMAQALVQVNLAGSDWPEETTQVTIATQDGRSMSASTDMSVGQPLDKSSARIRRKLMFFWRGPALKAAAKAWQLIF
jgi:hypothetical protein